jgi:hypothetical protein
VLSSTQAAGFNIFFLPTFKLGNFVAYDPTTTYSNYEAGFIGGWVKSTVQGLITWDGFIPSLHIQNLTAYNQVTANNSVTFVSNVASWFGIIRFLYTQSQSTEFLEFNGGEGLSAIWASIINNQPPPIVMLNTWNDYTESYMGPASQADLKIADTSSWQISGDYLFSHAGYTELNKYFIQWWKTGVQPTWPDAIYVFYRIAPMSVVASSSTITPPAISWNQQGYNPTLDDIYVTTILTAPATMRVTSGGNVTDTSVGAGLVHTRVPFTVGAQSFDLIRNGTTLIHVDGADIVSSLTYYYNANPISYYAYHVPDVATQTTSPTSTTPTTSTTGSGTPTPTPPTTTAPTPPTVRITSLANGAVYKRNAAINIAASASDTDGVASITIKGDNTTLAICTKTTSCYASWQDRQISQGVHTINATAVDALGYSASTSITLTKLK